MKEKTPKANPERPTKPDPIAEHLAAMPDWARAELEALRKHENTVVKALSDAKVRDQFLSDPAAVLRKLKIPVSAALGNRMQQDPTLAELKRGLVVRLPNGDLLQPRINIRFTKENR